MHCARRPIRSPAASAFSSVLVLTSILQSSWVDPPPPPVEPALVGGLFGHSIAGLGDIDGDAASDVLVGAPTSYDNAGSAWVFSGRDGSVLLTIVGPRTTLARQDDYLGDVVAGIGDVDDDGVPDFAVGARDRIEIYSGRSRCIWKTLREEDLECGTGFDFAAIGDVDGDRRPDLLIASRSKGVRGWIVSVTDGRRIHGPLEMPLPPGAKASNWRRKLRSGAVSCSSMAAIGDIDGDGARDAAFAVESIDDARALVALFSGRSGKLIRTHAGEPEERDFGADITSVGDVNLDGFADVAIAHPKQCYRDTDSSVPTLRIYSGRDGSVLHRDLRLWKGLCAPGPMALVGDVDADGIEEWIVGIPELFPGAGAAVLFSGRTRTSLLEWGGDPKVDDEFGGCVTAAADLDGDGAPDVLISSFNVQNPSWPGRVYAYSGIGGRRLHTWTLREAQIERNAR